MFGPRDHSQLDESKLLDLATGGDSAAAGELASRHWDALFRVAHLILRDAHAAEDVTQEALVAALSSLDHFDSDRPLRPWLVKILTNRALDSNRAAQRRDRLADQAAFNEASASAGHDELSRSDVRAGLELLSPEDRALLVLRYVLDYRSAEIGELLELPDGTVRSRLKRSLDQLRTTIELEAL